MNLLAQGQHRVQFVVFDALVRLICIGVLQHFPQRNHILQTVSHPGVGRQTVAPGPAGFLVIGFNAFGQIQVRDKADIGLVDAHAERDGRHYHQTLLH